MSHVTQELIEELISTVKDAKKFTVDQAPGVAKEMLLQEKISYIFSISVFVCLIVASLTMLLLSTTQPFYVGSAAVLFFSSIFLLCNIHGYIVFLAGPKVFLLEKLTKLIKG